MFMCLRSAAPDHVCYLGMRDGALSPDFDTSPQEIRL